MRTLASFQGIHSADKIVVCGCGASLQDFERPERFVTIGVNDVGRFFQPKYLLVADAKQRFKDGRFHYVESSQAEFLFTQLSDLGISHPNIVNFRLGEKDGTDFSDPGVLHYGVVTPYMALCLAAHMGATCVGLMGVDFTDHQFFAATGAHESPPDLDEIDAKFHRLGAALLARGIRVFNLSRGSRLTAFPKMSLECFAGLGAGSSADTRSKPLRIVSYSATRAEDAPSVLARCINARTPHHCRCLWDGAQGTGAAHHGDITWDQSPATAIAEVQAADLLVVQNGQVDPRRKSLFADKPVITMAHGPIANVDQTYISQGFPGVLTGQGVTELEEWSVIPTPVPLWEEAYRPGRKEPHVTICYAPLSRRGQDYGETIAYLTAVRILEKLAARSLGRLEVIHNRHASYIETLAMKRRAHIFVAPGNRVECNPASYSHDSLQALAAGCVVVSGTESLPDASDPFIHANLAALERVLQSLIERGPGDLIALGGANRLWLEQHWDFAAQWEGFWLPVIEKALRRSRLPANEMYSRANRAASSSQIPASSASKPLVKAVITTLDNLPLLKEQIEILRRELVVRDIVVVNNGSVDGTDEWLRLQPDLIAVNRENRGAGPGRNAGLDAAGEFDYVLMLDGGVRPLYGGVERMLAYLERHPAIDVLGVDHPETVATEIEACREWPGEIRDKDTYQNRRLSQTHYCLARYRAFDGFRFSEQGPFGEAGWGVDDDEMAYRWVEGGITVHAVTTVHPYRRASGSFQRLFRETGVWPNQYGSVYEKRLVFCQQNWPQFSPGIQWGEPWLTIMIPVTDRVVSTIALIKTAHDRMRQRCFPDPWTAFPNPYSIVALSPPGHPFLNWAEWRRLRQHHGDVILVNGAKVVRKAANESLWTGDFRVWTGLDYVDALRPNSHYFCVMSNSEELEQCAARFDAIHPDRNTPPLAVRMRLPAADIAVATD